VGSYVLGSYLTWGLSELIGISFLLLLPIALILTGIIAHVLDLFIFHPALKAGRRLEAMIASLGALVVIENILFLLAGPDTKFLELESTRLFQFSSSFGFVAINSNQLIQCFVSIILLVLLTLMITKSNWGIRFRAVDSNRELAVALGLRPWRLISEAQLLCACIAALSGVLFALDRDLVPDMTLRPMLHVTVAIVIGGLGRLLGPVLGAIVVTSTWHIAGVVFDTQWQDASVFVMLLLILLISPQGITGALSSSLRDT
jgi:branched-chain amino acid transport system permease protein